MTCPGSHQCAKYPESEKNRGGHACLVILPDISKRDLTIPGLGLIHCAESIRSYFRLKHGNNLSRPMEIGNCVQSHFKRHKKSYKHCKYGTKLLMSIATLAGSRVGFSEVKWHFAGGPCRKHQALIENRLANLKTPITDVCRDRRFMNTRFLCSAGVVVNPLEAPWNISGAVVLSSCRPIAGGSHSFGFWRTAK